MPSLLAAVGLMQVMPRREMGSRTVKMPNWLEERLSEPEINIKIGTWYLAYLINMFDGSAMGACSLQRRQTHVNAGWSRERGWNR